MQCEIRDCVLEQQKRIGGKTGETRIMSVSSGPQPFWRQGLVFGRQLFHELRVWWG